MKRILVLILLITHSVFAYAGKLVKEDGYLYVATFNVHDGINMDFPAFTRKFLTQNSTLIQT